MSKSAKKRKRQQREKHRHNAPNGRHDGNQGSSSNIHASSSVVTNSDHGSMISEDKRQPTSSSVMNVMNDSSLPLPTESRKRSRKHLEFVYPKKEKNGAVQLYSFTSKNKKSKNGKNGEDSTVSTASSTTVASSTNKKESIEDILSLHKKPKKRVTISTAAELSADTPPNTKKQSVAAAATLSGQQEEMLSPGKLSGKSVEEAVRDKSGCRPRANSTDFELNLPRRGLCDENMVLQCHKWININNRNSNSNSNSSSTPKGLVNLGNSCFLNSTLQCLAYLPPFCQSLLAMPDRSDLPQNNNGNHPPKKTSQGKRITLLLQALFRKVHASSHQQGGSSIAPNSMVKTLPTLGTVGSKSGGYKFRPGRQEDAHEFLVHLLDAMHDGELREAGINQRLSGWRDRLPVPRLDETTFVHRVFGGYLRSQLQCAKCGYCSNTYDPFLDLALEVSKKPINTVAAAFQEFTRKETLDSDNRWRCGGCRQYVRAIKALTVFRPPLSLCVQMKRFTFGGSSMGGFYSKNMMFGGGGGGGTKITKSIGFPAEMELPLSDGRSCAYALTGVVIHVGGSSNSGHYTAYVKKAKPGGGHQWYSMDDSYVEAVSEKTVLREKDAYLLFYCRKEVKLEFPAPPTTGNATGRRGSMTAEEATEHGRARARARADSLTQMDLEQNDDVTETSKVSAASSSPKDPAASLPPKVSLAAAKSKEPSKQKADQQAGKNGIEKPRQSDRVSLKAGSKDSPPNATLPAKNPTKDSKIASDDSSSDDSSLSDDSSSDEPSVSADGGDPPKTMQEANSTPKPKKQGDQQDLVANSQEKHKHNTPKSQLNGSGSSSEEAHEQSTPVAKLVPVNEEDNSSKVAKGAKDEAKKQARVAKGAAKTVVLDRGKGREKVSVVMGRSTKQKWVPQTSGRTKSGQEYDLLGNRTAGKWDDSVDPADASAVLKARSQIVGSMEKQNITRKRKAYLDRWDAALDRGHTKKVKEKRETNDPAAPNTFQRILSGLQKMKHGRKGHLGNTETSKKRKKHR